MNQYQPTSYTPIVYEQIFIDFLSGKEMKYENYAKELTERGWGEERYFDALVKDMEFYDLLVKLLNNSPDFNLNKVQDIFDTLKKYYPSDKEFEKTLLPDLRKNDKIIEALQKYYPESEDVKELNNTSGFNLYQLAEVMKRHQPLNSDFVNSVKQNAGFNLRQVIDIAKKYHPSDDKDVLRFSLLPEEQNRIIEIADKLALRAGDRLTFEGYNKEVVCEDYKNLPKDVDAFVIFSGHTGSATPAIEAWYEHYMQTGEFKKLVFLGLYDNQGNTFNGQSNKDGLKYVVDSEVEMYMRFCRDHNIPKKILEECLITPDDISTSDNIKLLAKNVNKYLGDKEIVNLAMFGYPEYNRRIAAEFTYGFNEMEKEGKVKDVRFVIPIVPRDKYEGHAYEDFDKVAQDIKVANTLLHIFITEGQNRYNSNIGSYPRELIPYMTSSLVYGWPNALEEVAGINQTLSTYMKMDRGKQQSVYKMEDSLVNDRIMSYYAIHSKMDLVAQGYVTAEMVCGNNDKEYAKFTKEEQENADAEELDKFKAEMKKLKEKRAKRDKTQNPEEDLEERMKERAKVMFGNNTKAIEGALPGLMRMAKKRTKVID